MGDISIIGRTSSPNVLSSCFAISFSLIFYDQVAVLTILHPHVTQSSPIYQVINPLIPSRGQSKKFPSNFIKWNEKKSGLEARIKGNKDIENTKKKKGEL